MKPPRDPDLFGWHNVPDEHYPEVPGHVADSATSAAAAEMADFADTLADRCEAWFRAAGGLRTCEDCQFALGGKHQSISARIRTDLFLNRKCLFKIATVQATGEKVPIWSDSSLDGLARDDSGRVIYAPGRTTSGRPAVLYRWGYRPEPLI